MDTSRIVTGRHAVEKRERARQLRDAMTPAETRLWDHVRAGRLHGLHFRRQQIIDGFIVDFYCHAVGLIIEVDGGVHDTQIVYDAERDRILSARGLRVLRLTNARVMDDLPGCLAEIGQAALAYPPAPLPEGKGEQAADRSRHSGKGTARHRVTPSL